MLFDTHAHLDADRFDADRAELLARLPGEGIGLLMNPGCDLASSKAAVALAEGNDWIYAAVGTHPDDAGNIGDEILDAYQELCSHSKVKAIGEIGLDYHYEDIPRAQQLVCFRKQMELARELDLPVIVHEREAHADGMAVVEEFSEVKGVFHCFSGSAEMAKWLTDRGWYIGFTGVVTFKNARRALEAAAAIPLEVIVIETDCPYMAPEPFRGRRNTPGYVYRVAEKLAELRGVDYEEFCHITFDNGKRLYRI